MTKRARLEALEKRESTGSSLQTRYASEAMSMSDQDDWEFADPDDAKTEIRAAVGISERCYRRRPR